MEVARLRERVESGCMGIRREESGGRSDSGRPRVSGPKTRKSSSWKGVSQIDLSALVVRNQSWALGWAAKNSGKFSQTWSLTSFQ